MFIISFDTQKIPTEDATLTHLLLTVTFVSSGLKSWILVWKIVHLYTIQVRQLVRQKGKFLAMLEYRSFTAAAPKLWNNLPVVIQNIKIINSFKSSLKDFLFKNAF